MLTISIAESLQGPATWSEWGAADADSAATAEAWQNQQIDHQWGLDAHNAEALADPNLWSPWPADAGLTPWPQESLAATQASEAATFALAAAMASCPQIDATGKTAPTNEAAFASPLRVPLPEPLAVEPLSNNLELGLELELIELPETVAGPQKISAPQGLGAHSSPKPVLVDKPAPVTSPVTLADATEHAPPGIKISAREVEGRSCTHVDWKIDDFSGKLQASMGRPVVSPAFSTRGLSNLRLMVFPDARDAVKSARSHERKGLYANMVKKGPLYGSLKLKADGLERATVMTFFLLVGKVRKGPLTYDFSEQAVLGIEDFGIDWLQQIEKPVGALHVGIEIIDVRQK